MSLSIITPHYNDLDGLKRIYTCLREQTSPDWEWLIVDDASESIVLNALKKWLLINEDSKILFIESERKTNASVCRNKGVENAKFENLVFLDADDVISQDFVLNRTIEYTEFAVFKNMAVVDRNGTHEMRPDIKGNYLDCFLNANFVWQTTAILWKKAFFMKIGQFDPSLERLQDVELSIRALLVGKNYKVIDNEVDFYYHAKPIRLKTDIVRKSCESVDYLILKLDKTHELDAQQRSLLKSYYFACVRNLHRSSMRTELVHIKESLKLFNKKKLITTFQYFVGSSLLFLYKYRLISDSLFIRINRYFFKK